MRKIDPENAEAAIKMLIEVIEELKQKSGNHFTKQNFLSEVESIFSTKLISRPYLLRLALRFFYFRYWLYDRFFKFKKFESTIELEAAKEKSSRLMAAAIYGSTLNEDSIEWLKKETSRMGMCQFDAVFLVWAGVIQPRRQKIVFNHLDRYSLVLMIPVVCFFVLLTASAVFCNCVTPEGKYYFASMALIQGLVLGYLVKVLNYDVNKVASKYYRSTGWRSSPVCRL